jgi:nucleoside-diphosphate-sugar epimerase
MASLLILGAGYLGAAVADRALRAGHAVTLADNWMATERTQLDGLVARGARVETADIRAREQLDALLAARPDRVLLLAAQASRPLADRDPDTTEETNLLGTRRVAQAVAAAGGPPLVFGSSAHVYGSALRGAVGPEHPYGPQGDLAHLSKVYGELCLRLFAERHGFAVALLRLGIVYGPGPVQHERPESVTVVDTFRRRAARGEPLELHDGGRATIGVVHLDDAARILLDAEPRGVQAANVVAETVTVAQLAALAEGREAPAGGPAWTFTSPYRYARRVEEYLRGAEAGGGSAPHAEAGPRSGPRTEAGPGPRDGVEPAAP